MSFPLKHPLSGLQTFTQWSALLAYVFGGLGLMAAPNLAGDVFGLNLEGNALGYATIGGGGLATVGFLYVVCARSRPQVGECGALLGTILERLTFVNLALICIRAFELVPLTFALALMGLDSTLALVSLVIWYREREGASFKSFIRQIVELLPPSKNSALSFGIQLVGYSQISIGIFGTFCTDILHDILHLAPFRGHSHGILASYFLSFAVIGWLHVLGGGGGNDTFPISCVFYRFVFSFPLIVCLHFRNQIESGLAMLLALFDLVSALLILILFGIDRHRVKIK